ncbi:curli production assembly/transport component CsgF [Alkalitalea saponilacus]|uniref:Curli production assembly/transport component CsgF n=1 Tax=Alkalitalea saponilacus TaxID=889453 RepID=A0A1T5CBV5_9BACT|nr:curli production assembly/transport component CsgF [Alkalitalea saponilacus]ASB49803.1 curli production assembly/transport component CsgF [Alkalitalea saponilacus]SKB56938.1 curli production assembly/transport component CsgF [Alkalitalea saponilacus]
MPQPTSPSRKLIRAFAIFAIILASTGLSSAQNFVYQPVNPAFGGNYLNYQWLLSSAQVQNTHEAKPADRATRDPLKDFEENLNRQILSQLSRNLMRNYFSEGFNEGHYNVGSYEIEITPGLGGLEIEILDTATGDKTTVTVPYF